MLIFQTAATDHNHRNGQAITPISAIVEPDDSHDAEVLPMFVIRFPDGAEIEAYPEEILLT